jgi:hypothetical protein
MAGVVGGGGWASCNKHARILWYAEAMRDDATDVERAPSGALARQGNSNGPQGTGRRPQGTPPGKAPDDACDNSTKGLHNQR